MPPETEPQCRLAATTNALKLPIVPIQIYLTLLQLNKYLKLDQKGSIMAEYVWVDANGETRSKSRVSLQSTS